MATLTSVVLAPVVEAWVTGGNDYEELGLGDTTYRNTPEQLSSPTNVVQVAAGGGYTVFVDASGVVRAPPLLLRAGPWACPASIKLKLSVLTLSQRLVTPRTPRLAGTRLGVQPLQLPEIPIHYKWGPQ